MKDLTQRQADILAVIAVFTAIHGLPPTIRQLMDAIGIRNINAMVGHLQRLRRKGVVTFEDNRARTLRVVRKEANHA